MADRKPLVAGNWKMNGLRGDGLALARDIVRLAGGTPPECDVLVCPPATLLGEIGDVLAGSIVALGGQHCHSEEKGAYTGDISAEMLRDAGCRYVILGHSERRHSHGEGNDAVHSRVSAAWRAGLTAVVCVGETREQREAGQAVAVVDAQIAGSIPLGSSADRLVVAYEPVWAIGTGLTPTTKDIIEIHAAIRAHLPAGTRILYGGSVNPKNAAEIMALHEVDGALVGGASLKAEDFWAIAQACD